MYESVRSWRNTVLIDNIQPTSESTNPMPHQQVNNKIYFLAYAYRARKVFYVLYIMFLSHAVFTMKYRGGPLSGGPPRASTVFESLPKHTVFLMEYCGSHTIKGTGPQYNVTMWHTLPPQ